MRLFRIVTLALAAGLLLAASHPGHAAERPDPKLTPGVALPVKAPEVCRPTYPATARNQLSRAQWRERRTAVYEAYGIPAAEREGYVVDHLIPLEIGGSNDLTNLWPQPLNGRWNAARKAKLKKRLYRLVCSGHLSIKEAQLEVAADWIATYRKFVSAR